MHGERFNDRLGQCPSRNCSRTRQCACMSVCVPWCCCCSFYQPEKSALRFPRVGAQLLRKMTNHRALCVQDASKGQPPVPPTGAEGMQRSANCACRSSLLLLVVFLRLKCFLYLHLVPISTPARCPNAP